MILFMTSSPGGMDRHALVPAPCPLDSRNGFVDRLRSVWTDSARVLFVAASPDESAGNDRFSSSMRDAFGLSGLSIGRMDICDSRNSVCHPENYDFIILSGGHVPTQNAFFAQIHLREALADYGGVIMGISAGTMNCASTVYAQPELPGEALDPGYRRFLPGLGLTDVMVLPHFQEIGDTMLDGLHNTRDLLLPDSMGRSIYALVDGSYILVMSGETRLYGEAFLARDGVLTQICRENESLVLPV